MARKDTHTLGGSLDAIARTCAATALLAALALALAGYGGTIDPALLVVFLLSSVAALIACLRADETSPGRWQSVGLAAVGVALLLRVAFLPTLEARGYVLLALCWMGLVTSIWLVADRRLRKALIAFIVLAAAMEAVYGLAQALGGLDEIFGYRRKLGRVATGTFINRNHFAAFLNMAIGLGLGWLVTAFGWSRARRTPRSEAWARSWLIVLACSLLSLALLLAKSRAGVITLAAMIAFVFLLLLVRSRTRGASAPPQVAVLLVLVTVSLGLLVGAGSVTERFTGQQGFARPSIYRDSLRLIADQPWTGVGPGMYRWRFQAYQTAPENRRVLHAHSDYLENAAEWGLPIALLTMALVFWRLYRGVGTFFSSRDPARQGLVLGCSAAMFSVLVHGLVDFNLRIPVNLVTFAVIVGLVWGAEGMTGGTRSPRRRSRAAAWITHFIRAVVCASLVLASWRVWDMLTAERFAARGLTVENLERAVSRDGSNPEHQAALGILYRDDPNAPDLERARSHLERAVELNPYDRGLHFELGRLYEAAGEYELAEASLVRSTAGNPQSGDRLWYLAKFHVLNGDREKMYGPLRSALSADAGLFRSAITLLVKTKTPPEQIDEIWPAAPSARLRLLRGLRLDQREDKRRYLAFSLEQWTEILSQGEGLSVEDGSFFIRSLLTSGEAEESRRQWIALAKANGAADHAFESGRNDVWNGAFEVPLIGGELDWQVKRAAGYSVRRLDDEGPDGTAALSIEFSGKENTQDCGVRQTVVVRPDSTYVLSFAARAKELTTDQGPYLEVWDTVARKSLHRSEQVLGTGPWRRYSSTFTVPEGTSWVVLQLRRNRSRRIDSRIAGELLLATISLTVVDSS